MIVKVNAQKLYSVSLGWPGARFARAAAGGPGLSGALPCPHKTGASRNIYET